MNPSTSVQEGARQFAIRRRDFSILVAQSEIFNCEVLSQLLKEQGYNVVGRAVELEDTLQQIRVKRPNCVILESDISDEHSFDIVEQMQATKFILYTRKPGFQDDGEGYAKRLLRFFVRYRWTRRIIPVLSNGK